MIKAGTYEKQGKKLTATWEGRPGSGLLHLDVDGVLFTFNAAGSEVSGQAPATAAPQPPADDAEEAPRAKVPRWPSIGGKKD